MKKALGLFAVLVLALTLTHSSMTVEPAPNHWGGPTFSARLTGDEEVVPVDTDTTGHFQLQFNHDRTKARFRELALRDLDEAFRAGVLGQQEAFAKGEPQAIMDAFLAERAARKKG